jgi:hypothetical protein
MLSAAKQFVFGVYGLDDLSTSEKCIPMGLPTSLMKKDLPTVWGSVIDHYCQYVVSPKANGSRELLGWFGWNQTQVAFMMNRSGRAKKITWKVHSAAWHGTLLDAEVIQEDGKMYVWVFDALMVNGNSVRLKPYHLRLAAAHTFLQDLPAPQDQWNSNPLHTVLEHHYFVHVSPTCWVSVKPIWYHTDVIHAMKWANVQQGLPEDGMVYTPLTKAAPMYRSMFVFKWKEAKKHTIDFLVQSVPSQSQSMDLFVSDIKGKHSHYARVPLRCDDPTTAVQPNRIYECRWDILEKTWYIHLRRDDKLTPNARFTADRTCGNIQEGLTLQDLVPVKLSAFSCIKN